MAKHSSERQNATPPSCPWNLPHSDRELPPAGPLPPFFHWTGPTRGVRRPKPPQVGPARANVYPLHHDARTRLSYWAGALLAGALVVVVSGGDDIDSSDLLQPANSTRRGTNIKSFFMCIILYLIAGPVYRFGNWRQAMIMHLPMPVDEPQTGERPHSSTLCQEPLCLAAPPRPPSS